MLVVGLWLFLSRTTNQRTTNHGRLPLSTIVWQSVCYIDVCRQAGASNSYQDRTFLSWNCPGFVSVLRGGIRVAQTFAPQKSE